MAIKVNVLKSIILGLLIALVSTSTFASREDPRKLSLRAMPSSLFGVTVDSVIELSDVVQSLDSLSNKPTARIVFDEFMPPSYYKKAVTEIHDVSFIMGEILDSFYVKQYSVSRYLKRTRQYLDTLGSKVDIWEIGNEINGNWLGKHKDVVAKMTGAYDLVEERGGRTAVTLYHDQSTEEMLRWARKNIPAHMKQGLDYVFVSFYEDDQNGIKPNWEYIFNQLAGIFPNSKIGFGEVGTKYKQRKEEYIRRYYSMKIDHPNYVGGYFWWYFRQDMVPKNKPMWNVLNSVSTSV